MNEGILPFNYFIVIWIAYGLLGLPLAFSKNLELKRRFMKPHIIGAGVLFVVGPLLAGFPFSMVLIMAPVVTVITVINLRRVRYCNRCGATVFGFKPFASTKFCASCGAPLGDGGAAG